MGSTYRVEVLADGRSRACERTITNEPIPGDQGFCQDRDLIFGVLPKQGVLYVHISSTPAVLEVRITRDGTELGEETFDVEYRTQKVGAGDCEQECQNSEDKWLTLASP